MLHKQFYFVLKIFCGVLLQSSRPITYQPEGHVKCFVRCRARHFCWSKNIWNVLLVSCGTSVSFCDLHWPLKLRAYTCPPREKKCLGKWKDCFWKGKRFWNILILSPHTPLMNNVHFWKLWFLIKFGMKVCSGTLCGNKHSWYYVCL